MQDCYGQDIKTLLVFTWKLQNLVWQVLSGSLPVTRNLRSRDIKCDTPCNICGAEKNL